MFLLRRRATPDASAAVGYPAEAVLTSLTEALRTGAASGRPPALAVFHLDLDPRVQVDLDEICEDAAKVLPPGGCVGVTACGTVIAMVPDADVAAVDAMAPLLLASIRSGIGAGRAVAGFAIAEVSENAAHMYARADDALFAARVTGDTEYVLSHRWCRVPQQRQAPTGADARSAIA